MRRGGAGRGGGGCDPTGDGQVAGLKRLTRRAELSPRVVSAAEGEEMDHK